MTTMANFIKLKERQRAGLQRDIELYLKNGGKIDHIPTGLSAIADGRVHNGHVVYSEEDMAKNKYRGPGIRYAKGDQ